MPGSEDSHRIARAAVREKLEDYNNGRRLLEAQRKNEYLEKIITGQRHEIVQLGDKVEVLEERVEDLEERLKASELRHAQEIAKLRYQMKIQEQRESAMVHRVEFLENLVKQQRRLPYVPHHSPKTERHRPDDKLDRSQGGRVVLPSINHPDHPKSSPQHSSSRPGQERRGSRTSLV